MSDKMPKYWICDDCAGQKGLQSYKIGNTISLGGCSWCDSKEDKWLTPLRDLRTNIGVRGDDLLTNELEEE